MTAIVNSNCIGCGLCETVCPAVFQVNSQGVAEVISPVSPEDEAPVLEAKGGCPVAAIETED